ncbi:MAG: recombination mediator RecR [Gemmatimonadota bacterium]|jgi:recombination protein RecR|nr:recombination protein RecR [Gemmatimonadota bacterium]MDP6529404.1 recombination mediator RecR [Gemmatimonadota bacterium]MDP6802705.1 recombination mediator RecR [Gemmatimonadota bacterium]MDP7032513.1 recombination mediator RecR [Gemmatimonadota bacterium]
MAELGSEALTLLAGEFARLPGIGRKTARRLALHVLKEEASYAESFAAALLSVKRRVVFCETCQNVTESSPCAICADSRRVTDLICVVEEPGDVLAIEGTGEYHGGYHVLHGVLSPLDGVGPEGLRVKELTARMRESDIREVILALDPDTEGDATSFYLHSLLAPLGCRVSRIARGIPVGGDLEFADQATLGRAILSRERMGE